MLSQVVALRMCGHSKQYTLVSSLSFAFCRTVEQKKGSQLLCGILSAESTNISISIIILVPSVSDCKEMRDFCIAIVGSTITN